MPQPCPSVNPHYPRIWTLHPERYFLSSFRDALLLRTTPLRSPLWASHSQEEEETRGNTARVEDDEYRSFL